MQNVFSVFKNLIFCCTLSAFCLEREREREKQLHYSIRV